MPAVSRCTRAHCSSPITTHTSSGPPRTPRHTARQLVCRSISVQSGILPQNRNGEAYQDKLDNVTKEEEEHYDKLLAENKKQAIRTPWMREGSSIPPVARARSAGAMTKGKLLTTPTRLFKLVLPLTTEDHNSDRKDVAPLALLIHPQQPLSYLERLIQSELPLFTDKDGKEKIPAIHFKAEDSMRDDEPPARDREFEEEEEEEGIEEESADSSEDTNRSATSTSFKDTSESKEAKESPNDNTDSIHTHISPHDTKSEAASALRGGPGEGGVESYSGLGRESTAESPATDTFVRWSKSTEIGDFVRDAARGKEFAVEIEGAPREIRVGVPSFGDRTYYLRMRLRKKSGEIVTMADIKKECDRLAELGAQRVAYAGFGGMVAWGGLVYYLTFMTELGWDVMEPVTYLVGLAGFVGGYAWFLLNKREASYRSAMNLTVSRRQNKLYESRGFDVRKWEYLMEEANVLRREIIAIASEYDTEWDAEKDLKDEKVVHALRQHRHKKKKSSGSQEEEPEEEQRKPKKFEGARG